MYSYRGDSNEYTQHTIFNIKIKITFNYPISAAVRIFQGTEERVRNSHGRRAISVRAFEILLYMVEYLRISNIIFISGLPYNLKKS